MGWEKVKLKDLAISLHSGGRPKGGAIDSGVFSLGAEHLDGKGGFNLQNGKFIPESYFENLEKGKIEKNDILIVKDGATTGKVSFVDDNFPIKKAAINEHVFKLIVRTQYIFPKYCFYHLFSSEGQKQILSDFRGATVGGISKEILNKIQISLPPLAEQKAIAEKLDKADALRKKDQEFLKYYDELAQSVFIDMFGDPVKNEKGWEMNLFGDKFQISSGGTPRTNVPEYWENGTISWIGSNMCQDKVLYENDGRFITELGLQNSSAKIFGINTVLVALVGATIGKTALLKFPTSTNQNIAGIQIKDYEPMFIFYLIQNLYNKFMELGNGGFKMANLTFIRNLPLISPSLFLQQNFANIIENIEEQKKKVKQQAQESENLFQALLQESFS